MALDKEMVTRTLAENQNQFITVKFLTKDDEVRVYNGTYERHQGPQGK